MKHIGGGFDITPGRAVTGVEAVAVRAARILDTPPGQLPQDPEWGWAIRDQIGVGIEPGDLRTVEAIGREAFRRDPEINDAKVAITMTGSNSASVFVQLATIFGETTIEKAIP